MSKIAAWILALAMIMTGAIFLTSIEEPPSSPPENLTDFSYLDWEKDTIYYAEDLLIVDTFALRNDSEQIYLLVMLQDKDEHIVLVNMPLDDSAKIWEQVTTYLDDENKVYGDLALNCYVKLEYYPNVDDTLYDYFDQAVNELESYTGRSFGTIQWCFKYVCDENGDPYAVSNGASNIGKTMGIGFIVGALLIIYFSTFHKPAAKKTDTSVRNVPVQPQNNSKPAPSQPAYTPQPVRPAPQQAQPQVDNSIMTQLDNYKALREAGYMSDAEFEQKRKELLGL